MATTITRAAALTAAIAAMPEGSPEVAVLEKMLAQVSKPSTRPTGPTKAQRENQLAAERVFAWALDQDGAFTSKDVVNGIPEIITTQKAVALLSILVKDGRVERLVEKSRTFFRVVREG